MTVKSDLSENTVNMTNLAARSAHGFSLREKRIAMAAISKIDSRNKRRGLSLKDRTVKLTAEQYAIEFDVDKKTAYRDLKEAADHLFSRYLRYMIKTPRGEKERKLRWVGSVTYHHGEGWVEMSFTEEITPHLFELTRGFTQYRLRQASSLRSVYSWRLLEYLLSTKKGKTDGGKIIVRLDALRSALDIPAKYAFGNIRQRVLDPAVRELSDKDAWVIEWSQIKEGRKVTAIKFVWHKDKQGRLPLL